LLEPTQGYFSINSVERRGQSELPGRGRSIIVTLIVDIHPVVGCIGRFTFFSAIPLRKNVDSLVGYYIDIEKIRSSPRPWSTLISPRGHLSLPVRTSRHLQRSSIIRNTHYMRKSVLHRIGQCQGLESNGRCNLGAVQPSA